MRIRVFERTDEAAVVDLWEACGLTRSWNDPHKDIARKLEVQPELFLVGVVDEAVMASLMAGYEGHRGWMNYLAVAPRFRGRGFGRTLVEYSSGSCSSAAVRKSICKCARRTRGRSRSTAASAMRKTNPSAWASA